MKSTRIHHCRLCGSSDLLPILDLGSLAVSDFVKASVRVEKYPLSLVLCDPRTGCGLLQLGNTGIEQDSLYRQYWYKSGINESMKRALKDVAVDCQRRITLVPGDVVVDIGANDGTLLSFFPQSLTRVGVEPAFNLQAELQNNTSVNVPEYFTKKAYKKYVGSKQAKLITSLAMFYDLEDPVSFAKDIKDCLLPEGIWVNQMTYLGSMLQKNDYPNICHEHLTYYSLTTFLEVLDRSDLKLVDLSYNEVNGGSIRTIVMQKTTAIPSSEAARARISALLEEERRAGLGKIGVYRRFARTVRQSKRELRSYLKDLHSHQKTIAIYGASTKGNTLLQYCELSHPFIDAAFDRNQEKVGLHTVATQIPIFDEKKMNELHPDVLLVLPWHFKDEFMKRERKFLENGGVMIFPLPTLEVVGQ